MNDIATSLKTVDQICIEMDQADTIARLGDLWNWVVAHKYKYSLVNLRFIREHVEARAQAINDHNGRPNKPFFKL